MTRLCGAVLVLLLVAAACSDAGDSASSGTVPATSPGTGSTPADGRAAPPTTRAPTTATPAASITAASTAPPKRVDLSFTNTCDEQSVTVVPRDGEVEVSLVASVDDFRDDLEFGAGPELLGVPLPGGTPVTISDAQTLEIPPDFNYLSPPAPATVTRAGPLVWPFRIGVGIDLSSFGDDEVRAAMQEWFTFEDPGDCGDAEIAFTTFCMSVDGESYPWLRATVVARERDLDVSLVTDAGRDERIAPVGTQVALEVQPGGEIARVYADRRLLATSTIQPGDLEGVCSP